MNYLEIVAEQVEKNPDKIILIDDENSKGYTYGQLDTISGKIHAYLKGKGIGKEDFVMICLPRGARAIMAMYGVWKAGAAFVLLENTYAGERIEFIRKDCGCRLVLDMDAWEEILECEPLEGFEPFDEHAAAFVVYTSGSTGNPKGVIHEYGQLNMIYESGKYMDYYPETDRFALPAPLNFVASLAVIVSLISRGVSIYVVAYSVLKNPVLMGSYYFSNKITGTFLTPSYLQKIKGVSPFMRYIVIGSEPARNIYLEGVKVVNSYSSSEAAFIPAAYEIEKSMDPTPIGGPAFDLKYMLIDDDGNIVCDGEEGEFVFENPYARGYVNLPDKTEETFRDGWYYTGDIMKKDEDGNLVVCGRKSDMFKINGNRVEPGEIEAVACRVLGVEWTAARGIIEPKQSYICVYYMDDIEVDYEKTRREMEKYLPYYMLPSYFIKIDSIPLKESGKMDRNALPVPKVEDYVSDYKAPRDELEKKLCDAFAKVLGLDRVGVTDDFYQLGGDSLTSIEVLTECGLNRLTAADIFAGHTVEKIIELYREKYPEGSDVSEDEIDDAARKQPHALTPFQVYMIDYQLYTPMSTMFNLFVMMKIDKEMYDMDRIPEALKKVIFNHPALLTKIYFNEDGEMMQKLCPEMFEEIELEHVTEEELESLKDTLVQPFRIMNSRLYRARVFETEEAGYIFFDVHHTVFDGTSFQVMLGNIIKACYDMPMERDYYYMQLKEKEDVRGTDAYWKSKKYLEDRYDHDYFVQLPTPDMESRDNSLDWIETSLEHCHEGISRYVKEAGTTKNVVFTFITLLTMAIYENNLNVKISWTHNGRDSLNKINCIGLMLYDLPAALCMKKDDLIMDLIRDVEQQINEGIANNSFSFTIHNVSVVLDDGVCFLYQEGIRDGGGMADSGIEMSEVRQNNAASENMVDVQVKDDSDGLNLEIDYNGCRYKKESMEKFSDIFVTVTEMFAEAEDVETMSVNDIIEAVKRK